MGHVICTYLNASTGTILPDFQPSLTQLARDSGLHRRTVMRFLNGLEKHGWLNRKRPSVEDARKYHARTQYYIKVGKNVAKASGAESPPSDTEALDLGTADPVSGGTAPHQSSRSSRSSRDDEIQEVIDAIRERANVTVTEAWAERVLEQIIGARDRVRDPKAVIRAAVRNAPRAQYTPTPQPPRYTRDKGFQ